MSATSYAMLEHLMRERVADRLHEAAQQRLIDAATGARIERRPRNPARLSLSLLRQLSSLI